MLARLIPHPAFLPAVPSPLLLHSATPTHPSLPACCAPPFTSLRRRPATHCLLRAQPMKPLQLPQRPTTQPLLWRPAHPLSAASSGVQPQRPPSHHTPHTMQPPDCCFPQLRLASGQHASVAVGQPQLPLDSGEGINLYAPGVMRVSTAPDFAGEVNITCSRGGGGGGVVSRGQPGSDKGYARSCARAWVAARTTRARCMSAARRSQWHPLAWTQSMQQDTSTQIPVLGHQSPGIRWQGSKHQAAHLAGRGGRQVRQAQLLLLLP